MKPEKNPCKDCPDRGCGRQGQCEKYMRFFKANREMGTERNTQAEVDNYTRDAVRRIISGRHNTMAKFRHQNNGGMK